MGSFYISYINKSGEQCLLLKTAITLQLDFLNQQRAINTQGYRLHGSRDTLLDISVRILKSHSSGKDSHIHAVKPLKSELLKVLQLQVLSRVISKSVWNFNIYIYTHTHTKRIAIKKKNKKKKSNKLLSVLYEDMAKN